MDSSATRKPDLKTEAIAGITTFFTMAYIVVVNPQILSADGKTGMAFTGVLTATMLVCFTMTLLMGMYAKLPFAVAPGMGINAFFTYTIILGKGVPWPTALGIIFWAGVFFLLISVTPVRELIAKAIPKEIRIAAAAGIGIFLTLKLSLLPSIIAVLFTDLFDSISTFIGVAHAADLLDEHGHPRNLREGLIVDSLATLGAGLAGSSSGTAYIESIAGISMGGRTGLTSVFTALCFLPCFFIAPLAGTVPPYATAAVLILVGAAMFQSVGQIKFSKIEEGVPAFLTLILIPLTFSITQGILWGFISHIGLYLMVGRRRDLHPVMYVLAVISQIREWSST